MTYSTEKDFISLLKDSHHYKQDQIMYLTKSKIDSLGIESSNEQINYFIEDSSKWLFVLQIDHYKNFDQFLPLKTKIDTVSSILSANCYKTFVVILHYDIEDIYNTQMREGIVSEINFINNWEMYFIENLEKSFNKQFIELLGCSFNKGMLKFYRGELLKGTLSDLIKKSYSEEVLKYMVGSHGVMRWKECSSA